MSRWYPGSFGRPGTTPSRQSSTATPACPWLRLKTDSVWPPIFLHASHNLWMQSIFTPLTIDTEYTKWIAGNFGLAFVVVAAVAKSSLWITSA